MGLQESAESRGELVGLQGESRDSIPPGRERIAIRADCLTLWIDCWEDSRGSSTAHRGSRSVWPTAPMEALQPPTTAQVDSRGPYMGRTNV